jgi:hypothetical protein
MVKQPMMIRFRYVLPVLVAAALVSVALVGAAPAFAETNDSVYTSLDLAQCRQEAADPEDPVSGGVWWCAGYQGMPVRVAEGDLRYLVSYGENAADEIAAGETLPAFNRIGETLEWRLHDDPTADGRRPIATILRYFTEAEGGSEGQVLVITKIGGPGQICHVGYVDATANPEANLIARQIADSLAPTFGCGRDVAQKFGY